MPREGSMKRPAAIATGAALLLACALAAQAQEKVSEGVVKIGMLEDMASIYADITGVGAVTAAKMAVEDFGGKVLGKPISGGLVRPYPLAGDPCGHRRNRHSYRRDACHRDPWVATTALVWIAL